LTVSKNTTAHTPTISTT